MEFDITGNLKVNTQQAEQTMNSFAQNMNIPLMNGNVSDLGPIQGTSTQQKIENAGESMENLNDVMSKVKDSFKDILVSMKSFSGDLDTLGSKLPDTLQKQRKDEGQSKTQSKELMPVQAASKEVIGVAEAGSDVVRNVANENISGGLLRITSELGKAIMGLGPAGMALGAAILTAAGAAKGADVLADKYEEASPSLQSLTRNFGGYDVNKNSSTKNSINALRMYNKSMVASLGTGLDTDEFINLSTSLSQYGINNQDRANAITRSAGMWGNYTGADTSQILNFAGMIERYGGNGEKSIEAAYKAARQSGLEKEQFGEFLNGLETVVENGISKGFIRSAEDVTEELANISLLSGNSELWSGKNGAKRYEQMGSAMNNATSLNSTASMLLYQAMDNSISPNGGNNWIDVMSNIESGKWGNKEFLSSYRNSLNKAFNGDKDQMIATIKENFGLNWTGAKDFYEKFIDQSAGNNRKISEADLEKEMENFKKDPTVKSDAQNMQDALKKINDAIIDLGRNTYTVKLAPTEAAAKIADSIGDKNDKKNEVKLFKDNNKVDGVNYNNIIGKSYYSYDENTGVGTYSTTPIFGAAESTFTIKDLKDEAENEIHTPTEELAFSTAQNFISQGGDPELFRKFLSEISASYKGRGRSGEGLVPDDDRMLKAIENLTAAMNRGVTVNIP